MPSLKSTLSNDIGKAISQTAENRRRTKQRSRTELYYNVINDILSSAKLGVETGQSLVGANDKTSYDIEYKCEEKLIIKTVTKKVTNENPTSKEALKYTLAGINIASDIVKKALSWRLKYYETYALDALPNGFQADILKAAAIAGGGGDLDSNLINYAKALHDFDVKKPMRNFNGKYSGFNGFPKNLYPYPDAEYRRATSPNNESVRDREGALREAWGRYTEIFHGNAIYLLSLTSDDCKMAKETLELVKAKLPILESQYNTEQHIDEQYFGAKSVNSNLAGDRKITSKFLGKLKQIVDLYNFYVITAPDYKEKISNKESLSTQIRESLTETERTEVNRKYRVFIVLIGIKTQTQANQISLVLNDTGIPNAVLNITSYAAQLDIYLGKNLPQCFLGNLKVNTKVDKNMIEKALEIKKLLIN